MPREEVLRGGLVDKHFAAQLDQVVVNAPGYHDYADADSFFKITHPTRGLKDLLAGTFARLSHNAAAAANAEHAVYRYETSFGGGKTHGLIALYHLASGARPPNLDEFINPAPLPSRCSVAAVVGDSLDPVNGLTADDITTYTLWGEIDPSAAANELIRTADRLEQAPIKLADLDAVPEHETELQPAMTLNDLRDALLSIPWCRNRFTPHPDFSDAWLLTLDDAAPHPVTFGPARYQDTPNISLLTWGSPLLNRLLNLADLA